MEADEPVQILEDVWLGSGKNYRELSLSDLFASSTVELAFMSLRHISQYIADFWVEPLYLLYGIV